MHHTEALLELAAEGHLEPIAALIAAGLEDHAILAASAALQHSPDSDVIAWMAASAGPNCDQLIRRLVPHIRSRAALEAMVQRSEAFPSAHGLLRTLLPAVR